MSNNLTARDASDLGMEGWGNACIGMGRCVPPVYIINLCGLSISSLGVPVHRSYPYIAAAVCNKHYFIAL